MPLPPAPPPPPPVGGAPPPSTTDIVAPPVLVGVPTNVTVTAEDRFLTIGWTLVSGADSYRVEWETDPKPLEDTLGTGSVTHGETAPLANGILYTYTVVRADGFPVVVSAIPSAASGAPTGLSVTPGLTDNALSWSPAADATADTTYRVYWSFTAGVTPFSGTRIEVGSATSYVHTGLEAGTDYHYVVTAVSSKGVESAASAGVGGRPGQTATVKVMAGDRRVTLSWTDAVAPTTITYTKSLALFAGSPSRITNLENGTRYGVRVTPQFAQGNGRPSTRVYATPAAPAAGVPQGVTIIAGGDENTITWSPVLGATSYDVAWDGTSAGSATVTGAAFRHAGLTPSSVPACLAANSACPAYSYTVTATVSGGGAPSAKVGAVSIPFQPFPPLITNTTPVILAGLKPSGTSIALTLNNDVRSEIVSQNRDTGWESAIELLPDKLNTLAFVAIDDAGHVSAATSYQITLDKTPPNAPAIITKSCAASTVGPPRATFTGTKDASTAILTLEPGHFERLVVGADDKTTWTASVDASLGAVDFTFIAKDVAGNASSQVVAQVTCP